MRRLPFFFFFGFAAFGAGGGGAFLPLPRPRPARPPRPAAPPPRPRPPSFSSSGLTEADARPAADGHPRDQGVDRVGALFLVGVDRRRELRERGVVHAGLGRPARRTARAPGASGAPRAAPARAPPPRPRWRPSALRSMASARASASARRRRRRAVVPVLRSGQRGGVHGRRRRRRRLRGRGRRAPRGEVRLERGDGPPPGPVSRRPVRRVAVGRVRRASRP